MDFQQGRREANTQIAGKAGSLELNTKNPAGEGKTAHGITKTKISVYRPGKLSTTATTPIIAGQVAPRGRRHGKGIF